jgi:hypothetical protein
MHLGFEGGERNAESGRGLLIRGRQNPAGHVGAEDRKFGGPAALGILRRECSERERQQV